MNTKLIALMPLLAGSLFASPLPQKAEVLATNTVVAMYTNTYERPCMHRTADCPTRCGHGKKIANFRVLANENYAKPGKYGDAKSETGSTVMVDVLSPVPGQDDAAVQGLVSSLKPGDVVRMTVTHYYVEENGCMYPVRPVTSMEKLEGVKPAQPVKPVEDPDSGVMPLQMLRRAR